MTRTRGPWVWDKNLPSSVYAPDATGTLIANCGPFNFVARSEIECAANAEFIVRACNSHDELVDALKALSDMYEYAWDRVDGALVMMGPSIERFEDAHEKAREILARATKEGK